MFICICAFYRMTLVSKTTIRLDFLTHKTVHISIEIVIWFFQTTNISIAQVLMLWIILILSYIRVHINWFDIRIIFQWLGWVKPTPSITIFVCCWIIQVGLLILITLICVSCWLIWNIFVASMNIYDMAKPLKFYVGNARKQIGQYLEIVSFVSVFYRILWDVIDSGFYILVVAYIF